MFKTCSSASRWSCRSPFSSSSWTTVQSAGAQGAISVTFPGAGGGRAGLRDRGARRSVGHVQPAGHQPGSGSARRLFELQLPDRPVPGRRNDDARQRRRRIRASMMLAPGTLRPGRQPGTERPELSNRHGEVPDPVVQAELERRRRPASLLVPQSDRPSGWRWALADASRRRTLPGRRWRRRPHAVAHSRHVAVDERRRARASASIPTPSTAVENVFFYWVRLTPHPNSPLAAKQTISWTGSGPATITVRDNSDGSVFPVVSNLAANSYLWNYGVLAPGSYTLIVTNSQRVRLGDLQHQPSSEHRGHRPVSDDRRRLRDDRAWQRLGHEQRRRHSTDRQRQLHAACRSAAGSCIATNTNDDPERDPALLLEQCGADRHVQVSISDVSPSGRWSVRSRTRVGRAVLLDGAADHVGLHRRVHAADHRLAGNEQLHGGPGVADRRAPDGGLEPLNVPEAWTAGTQAPSALRPARISARREPSTSTTSS